MSALHDFIATEAEYNIKGLHELLEGGENPNSQDRSGRTPLHMAVLRCERRPQDTDYLVLAVRKLIHYGANVNQGNNMAKTPLQYAVGCRNRKMIKTLLQCGAQINQRDIGGYAAIHFATSKRKFRRNISYDLDLEVVKLLFKYGLAVNMQSVNRETALMLAVHNNDLYVVRELLKHNASGHIMDRNGNSALHYALNRAEVNLKIVLELVKIRCSFTRRNLIGQSPLVLFFRRLLETQAPQTEAEKAKFITKLCVLAGDTFNIFYQMYIKKISQKYNLHLPRFLALCDREIQQMRADMLSPDFSVYDIAFRGCFYSAPEFTDHIPLEIFDKMLKKLTSRQYPVYCDLIAAGICSPYMNNKFADLCSCVAMDDCFLNFDEYYIISFYLSHFDMLNMMIACFGNWRSYWYLPRLTYYTRCAVS